ncbi:hypothetical protein [Neorhizobium huautlense]|uniref:hypothetical protein n=1 Tax=Neorhizobium huautlense TaxID=67774 RepID=UPI00130017F0|nr:hypothetical protein [Neorhizobium huautlense]
MHNETFGHRAFLTRYASPRTAGEPIPGQYSHDFGMWVVASPDGNVPLIDTKSDLIEITTKTKVEQESDDTPAPFLEIQTKTETHVEGDDQVQHNATHLLEITTKTDAQMESDDTSPRVHGFL